MEQQSIFETVFDKFSTFETHHQIIFTIIIGVAVITFSWGVEKILETFIFTRNSLVSYTCAIILGLLVLWVTKHFILHVI